jgi:uncharacterized membrane protein YoaK (UPF0700 family)
MPGKVNPTQVRPLKAPAWALLPTITGIEVILIVAAFLALACDVAQGIEIIVIFVALALRAAESAFRRVGGISVHTTCLTGMIRRGVTAATSSSPA